MVAEVVQTRQAYHGFYAEAIVFCCATMPFGKGPWLWYNYPIGRSDTARFRAVSQKPSVVPIRTPILLTIFTSPMTRSVDEFLETTEPPTRSSSVPANKSSRNTFPALNRLHQQNNTFTHRTSTNRSSRSEQAALSNRRHALLSPKPPKLHRRPQRHQWQHRRT